MAKKILTFSTYPINSPVHGGQRRSAAINRAIKRAGLEPVFVAVYNPPSYSHGYERGPNDIQAGKTTLQKINENPVLEDVCLGEACYGDPQVKRQLTVLLERYKPAALVFEQPYLYIGIKKLIKELGLTVPLIYSSHNIENQMKRGIYADHQDELRKPDAAEALKKIQQAERSLSKNAKFVITVSKADLNEHKKMGAKRLVLVPNGIDPVSATRQDLARWRRYFKNYGVRRAILFTGSAHPPNWKGFLKIVGGRLGFLPIDVKLMVAGDIGDALAYVLYREDPVYSSSFWLRAHNCKRLTDSELGALLELCDLIILPITEGGGSNLKTAEAIYSGKKILATSYAMRGYEEFKHFPNVLIEDEPAKFKSKMVQFLKESITERSPEQIEETKKVLWDYRIRVLTEEMRKLA